MGKGQEREAVCQVDWRGHRQWSREDDGRLGCVVHLRHRQDRLASLFLSFRSPRKACPCAELGERTSAEGIVRGGSALHGPPRTTNTKEDSCQRSNRAAPIVAQRRTMTVASIWCAAPIRSVGGIRPDEICKPVRWHWRVRPWVRARWLVMRGTGGDRPTVQRDPGEALAGSCSP